MIEFRPFHAPNFVSLRKALFCSNMAATAQKAQSPEGSLVLKDLTGPHTVPSSTPLNVLCMNQRRLRAVNCNAANCNAASVPNLVNGSSI